MNARRTFADSEESVRESRRFVSDLIADLPSDVQDAVALMVSELATNALIHAMTGFEVRVERTAGDLRVSVTDKGDGVPSARSPGPSEPHGRGLLIVNELADEWGTNRAFADAGTTVWFRLRLSAPARSEKIGVRGPPR